MLNAREWLQMIKLLSSEEVIENRKKIKDLLRYCRETSTAVVLPESYYDDKLNGLINYIKENKAYFFVAQEDNVIVGFLWACEIERDIGNVFHVLYFAVLEMHQRKGYGQLLIEAAQLQAETLHLKYMELNVYASNQKALDFYKKNKFYDDHITMRKKLN